MWTIGEEEIPETKYLGQRRRAGTESEHAGKGIELGGETFREEVATEARINSGKNPIDKRDATMYAVHSATDVSRALACQQSVESDKSLGFRTSGIEEWSCKDVHALDIRTRFGG